MVWSKVEMGFKKSYSGKNRVKKNMLKILRILATQSIVLLLRNKPNQKLNLKNQFKSNSLF